MTDGLRARRARHLEGIRERLGLGSPDEADADRADRAQRLDTLLAGDTWRLDLAPLLSQSHERARQVSLAAAGPMRDEMIGYQKALEDFVALLGGQVVLGQQAITRIRERQVQAQRARLTSVLEPGA